MIFKRVVDRKEDSADLSMENRRYAG